MATDFDTGIDDSASRGLNVGAADQARLRLAIEDLSDAEDPRVQALAGSMSALLYPDGSQGAIEKADRDRQVEIRKQLDHLRQYNPAAAEAFERSRAA